MLFSSFFNFLPALFVFLVGLFFGSFFGVLIDRIPKNKDIVKGRSKCDFCNKDIKWYDLVPVLSFVALGGRCRNCKKKLSIRYPLLEILTGLLFLISYIYFFNLGLITFFYNLVILSSFFVIFFMDLKYWIIPDRIVFPAAVLSIIYFAFFQKNLLLNHLLSGFGAFLFFVAISYGFYFITKKEGMGGGDVKLSFLLGLYLGFPLTVVGLYIAFLTGAAVSLILILWKKKRFQKDSVPFGPFLILGSLASLAIGNQILHVFLNLSIP